MIKLTNISKKYTLHHQKPTLIENIVRAGKKEEVWALRDINFSLKQGESLGIVGHNGSGKTTLLKIIAGVTTPTRGKIEKHGRTVSLISLQAGFHSELTGEENIYLNGLILGMSKKEIQEKYDQIVEYSELGKYIDAPFYTYSNGMALKLGFSIAVHSSPNILVIDEILAVGDTLFQKKCLKTIKQLIGQVRCLIYASHDLISISSVCTSTLVLDHGSTVYLGNTQKAIKTYLDISSPK